MDEVGTVDLPGVRAKQLSCLCVDKSKYPLLTLTRSSPLTSLSSCNRVPTPRKTISGTIKRQDGNRLKIAFLDVKNTVPSGSFEFDFDSSGSRESREDKGRDPREVSHRPFS